LGRERDPLPLRWHDVDASSFLKVDANIFHAFRTNAP
jgi:hypothetical protein